MLLIIRLGLYTMQAMNDENTMTKINNIHHHHNT